MLAADKKTEQYDHIVEKLEAISKSTLKLEKA